MSEPAKGQPEQPWPGAMDRARTVHLRETDYEVEAEDGRKVLRTVRFTERRWHLGARRTIEAEGHIMAVHPATGQRVVETFPVTWPEGTTMAEAMATFPEEERRQRAELAERKNRQIQAAGGRELADIERLAERAKRRGAGRRGRIEIPE